MAKIRVILLLCALAVVFPSPVFGQSAGWGEICNTSGVPHSGFLPNLVGLGNYPDNPYTDVDIDGSGCSWRLLPLSENVYVTPSVSVAPSEAIRFRFYHFSPITQDLIVSLHVVDDQDDLHTINFNISFTSGDWSQNEYIWDGGTNNPLVGAYMSFSNPDSNVSVAVDNISISEHSPIDPTPTSTLTATPTPTPTASTPTPTPTADGACVLLYDFDSGNQGWLNSGFTVPRPYYTASGQTETYMSWYDYGGSVNGTFRGTGTYHKFHILLEWDQFSDDWRSATGREITASDMIHLQVRIRAGQSIGSVWLGWPTNTGSNAIVHPDGWGNWSAYTAEGIMDHMTDEFNGTYSVNNVTAATGYISDVEFFMNQADCSNLHFPAPTGTPTPTASATIPATATGTPTETATPLPFGTSDTTATPPIPNPTPGSTSVPVPSGPGPDDPFGGGPGVLPTPGISPGPLPTIPPFTQCIAPPVLYQFGYFTPPSSYFPAWIGWAGLASEYWAYFVEVMFYLLTWVLYVAAFFGNIFVAIGNFGLVWWYAMLSAWFYFVEIWTNVVFVGDSVTQYGSDLSLVFDVTVSDAPADFEGAALSPLATIFSNIANLPVVGTIVSIAFALLSIRLWIRVVNSFSGGSKVVD